MLYVSQATDRRPFADPAALGWKVTLPAVHRHPPLPQQKLLCPAPRQLSLPAAAKVGMKSLQVKQGEREASLACLIWTEVVRVKSWVPGWEVVTPSADPKEGHLRTGASQQRRLWVCQCTVCFCLHLSSPSRRRTLVISFCFVHC